MDDQSSRVSGVSRPFDDVQRIQSRWSISARLLLTVNGVCVVLLLLLMAQDYRQETKRRLSDKRIALHEEAVIMLVAVRDIQHHGVGGVQTFVDQACAQMEETHSPGHHIVLRFGDHVLQAESHHRATDDMLLALETAASAPENRGWHGDRELIVGMATEANLSIYVSEVVDEIRRQVISDSFRRLGGLLLMAIVAAAIVNVVLFRVVVRPIERLVGIVEDIGAGNFDQHQNGFRSRELSFLSRAINRMSDALALSEQQRQSQLDKARRIQQNLLPVCDDLSGAKFAVRYEPADDVAGDFYDVRRLEDGSWVILLADVTGHGIPAAMNATLLKTHFAEACERFSDVLSIVQHVNRRFTPLTLVEDFATGIVLRFVPDANILQVVNAGHDAGLLRSPDGTLRECKSSGLLMGVDADAQWEVEEFTTSPGVRLLAYTDGISETMDSNNEMFGRDRVVDLLHSTNDRSPDEALDAIVNATNEYRRTGPQLDDVTAILIEF